MKCPKCGTEHKTDARACRKCGTPRQSSAKPAWAPTWKWHLKVLGVIYLVLVVLFFVINWAMKPYMRQFPKEITPWLDTAPKEAQK